MRAERIKVNETIMRACNFLEPVIAFLLFSLITSCAGLKKMSLSCPEPVSKYPTRTAVHQHRQAKNITALFQQDNRQHSLYSRYTSNSKSAKSTKQTQNTDIKQIPSPATETNTADKTE